MKIAVRVLALLLPVILATSCSQANVPDGRSVDIPTITPPLERYKGVNEKNNPVTRVKLGKDVLVPQAMEDDPLPDEEVGPFELRGETLASALQLILDDYDISLAFESDLAMTNRITVANLRGKLDNVVDRVCELANLYCHYDNGVMVVKETESFIVDLPPLGNAGGLGAAATTTTSTTGGAAGGAAASGAGYGDITAGLEAIIGEAPTVDATTRVMIYTATQRANKNARKYFDRLRKNTALIIYETNIWEVNLSNENRTGIDWTAMFNNVGNFNFNVRLPGGAPSGAATPISITPTYTGSADISSRAVLQFISEHGTVKTVSQPQLTVLSGSSATLAVSQSENFVSGVSRTPSTTPGVPDTVATTTDTVTTGLAMSVASAWDQATVYGTISIQLDELLDIDEFTPDTNTTIQLPQTTSRTLSTQIRVRPGDAILIAGLVTERDDYSGSGPGFLQPLIQTARAAATRNTELVFLLRPRVIVYVPGDEDDTPDIEDAPREKKHRPMQDVTLDVGKIFDDVNAQAQAPGADAPLADIPLGISAAALAPAEPEELPDYQSEQSPELPAPSAALTPVPLSPPPEKNKPAENKPEENKIESDPPEDNSLLPPSWLPSQRGGQQ